MYIRRRQNFRDFWPPLPPFIYILCTVRLQNWPIFRPPLPPHCRRLMYIVPKMSCTSQPTPCGRHNAFVGNKRDCICIPILWFRARARVKLGQGWVDLVFLIADDAVDVAVASLFGPTQNGKPDWCCLSWQKSADWECVSPGSKYSAVLSELMPYLGTGGFYHKRLIYQSFQSCWKLQFI